LAFSVPKGVDLPPSLKNIFRELENDVASFKRSEANDGCLEKWTQQGVFLLNAFLTVELEFFN
jgi:uracil-DNA glycosylase